MKSPTGKENSESILASSLAGGIVRCHLKRRQRYQWAGLLSFRKAEGSGRRLLYEWRKATRQPR